MARVLRAIELLAQTELWITYEKTEVGFEDPRAFSAVFTQLSLRLLVNTGKKNAGPQRLDSLEL